MKIQTGESYKTLQKMHVSSTWMENDVPTTIEVGTPVFALGEVNYSGVQYTIISTEVGDNLEGTSEFGQIPSEHLMPSEFDPKVLMESTNHIPTPWGPTAVH